MTNISVVTIAYRPGYIDSLVAALAGQTMQDFEYVLADELWERRAGLVRDLVANRFPLIQIPLEPVPYSNTAHAMNTALNHCHGELVYFLADYMYPHPRCLERHWDIYKRFGPKVFISGALLDRLTSRGQSFHTGSAAPRHTVMVGDLPVTYPEHMPPIEWPLKDRYQEPIEENLLSIFRKPFVPEWPVSRPRDARMGEMAELSVGPGLWENVSGTAHMWYAGRNDSAPLAVLRAVGGMPEPKVKGQHGGMDTDLEVLMRQAGCRYLLDQEAPAYILPHPWRKPEAEYNKV